MGKNRDNWHPWRSERLGTPTLKLHRVVWGALLRAAPQGLRTDIGLWGFESRDAPTPYQGVLDFSPSFFICKPSKHQWSFPKHLVSLVI